MVHSSSLEPVAEIHVSQFIAEGEHGRYIGWLTNPIKFAEGTPLYLRAAQAAEQGPLTIHDYHPNLGYTPASEIERLNTKILENMNLVKMANDHLRLVQLEVRGSSRAFSIIEGLLLGMDKD